MAILSNQTNRPKQSAEKLDQVREIFRDYLKRNKLRQTPERFAVLSEVYAADDHFDADELFMRLKLKGEQVSPGNRLQQSRSAAGCRSGEKTSVRTEPGQVRGSVELPAARPPHLSGLRRGARVLRSPASGNSGNGSRDLPVQDRVTLAADVRPMSAQKLSEQNLTRRQPH